MKVKIKGGETLELPDYMDKDEVREVLRKKFPKDVRIEIIKETTKEIIKEIPRIVEKVVIKEVPVPRETNAVPMQLIQKTLSKIEEMLKKPPVVVNQVKPGAAERKGWKFEITDRDRFGNISSIEAIPDK